MTDDAAFGKDFASGCQLGVPRHTFAFQFAKLLASRRIFQPHRFGRFKKKLREVIDVTFVYLPIDRVLFGIGDFKGLLFSETDKKVLKSDPTLGEHADVQIHTRQRAPPANGVRAFEQDAWHRARIGIRA